jgi:hypothetical protein
VCKNLRWNEIQIKYNNKTPEFYKKCVEQYHYDFDVGNDLKMNDEVLMELSTLQRNLL